jgi:membrane-associated HD superfamily phosphohydrolase
MNFFLRLAAYLFHPLFIPLLGAITYYNITPRYNESLIVQSKIFAIIIITLLIPIITFFLLKNLNVITSIHLKNVEERKYPLMIQCILILLIIKMVFSPYESIEMYYFFLGILCTTLSALMLVFFKFKASLHQMGIAGITMFIIALSVHFKVNLLMGIAIFFICNGWVASSRLHTNSHTVPELITGFFIGIIPQLIMLNFWL